MKTQLGQMLDFVLSHEKEAYICGGKILVICHYAYPAEGQSGSHIESARTWGELRAILGY